MSQLMVLSMLLFFGLTVPVAVSIGLASMVAVGADGHMTWLVIAQQLYAAMDKYPLVAVPFFILAGNLMEAGGISERMVEFAKSVVGGVQGGLACSCVLTCMIFAAVAGSSVATTFAVGAILIPAMVKHGYPPPFAASLQASAAELGVIIPPSIPMILFAVSTDTSVGEVFISGIGPGILIAVAMMLYVWLYARSHGYGTHDGDNRLPVPTAFRKAWWALLMPVIILGGIYGGIFTHTEASAVAVVYALFVGIFIYRRLDARTLSRTFHRSVVSTAIIMFIIANAGVFGFLLNRAQPPLSQQLHVPDGRERGLVHHRHVHRDVRLHRGAGPAAAAGRHAVWRRSRAFRRHHGGEPGLGHGDAALWREPVCRLYGGQCADREADPAVAAFRGRRAVLPDGDHVLAGSIALFARCGVSLSDLRRRWWSARPG
jgi:tripartite ATP-independent transporter DctM subunit